MKTDPLELYWDQRVPLTARKPFPKSRTDSHKQINLPTSNQVLITDGGTTADQVLSDNGVGSRSGYDGSLYAGTEQAFDVLEQFTDEYVDDRRIISSRSIANAVNDDIPVQEIGKTLAAHLDGRTAEGFLEDFEVSKWNETSPIKWAFKRVSGDADIRRSRRLQKTDLVREITEETGAEGERFAMVDRGGVRWERTSLTLPWMQDVLEAVCETIDYTPGGVADHENDLTRREWIDELTQAGATQVLERALDIDAPGADTSWNKSTCRAIHEVVVEGRDPSEVRT